MEIELKINERVELPNSSGKLFSAKSLSCTNGSANNHWIYCISQEIFEPAKENGLTKTENQYVMVLSKQYSIDKSKIDFIKPNEMQIGENERIFIVLGGNDSDNKITLIYDLQ